MKQIKICLLLLLFFLKIQAQEKYVVYDSLGKEVSIKEIVTLANEKPLIFFGEVHDQKLAHQAELDLLTELYASYNTRIILGMEMFEADVQPIIDEYFSGDINQKSFESEARIWSNYKEDYKPLLEFAKENKLKLIATNVPRRYANSVYHQGFQILDHLSIYAKQFLPDLPLKVDTTMGIYKEMLVMVPDHANFNMIYSQALKDATMAHFILKNKERDQIFLHINGSYHSKNKQGILSFLNEYDIDKTITINTLLKNDSKEDIDFSLADFTVLLILNESN